MMRACNYYIKIDPYALIRFAFGMCKQLLKIFRGALCLLHRFVARHNVVFALKNVLTDHSRLKQSVA